MLTNYDYRLLCRYKSIYMEFSRKYNSQAQYMFSWFNTRPYTYTWSWYLHKPSADISIIWSRIIPVKFRVMPSSITLKLMAPTDKARVAWLNICPACFIGSLTDLHICLAAGTIDLSTNCLHFVHPSMSDHEPSL